MSGLGVIDDLRVDLAPGLVALTGETGAGKTLVVEALQLLLGGRADPAMVRHGSEAALVEGRFLDGGEERVLRREVPAGGRSKAYVDGRMVTAGTLAEVGSELAEVYGQHVQQSLALPAQQRAALDRYAGVGPEELERCRRELGELDRALGGLGGDEESRARELEVLSFQVRELDAAELDDPKEQEALEDELAVLASAEALRQAAAAARASLSEEGGARDVLGRASTLLAAHGPLEDLAARLGALEGELDDLSSELRRREESFEDDPERLAAVQQRLRLLFDLRRKYGPSLEEVMLQHERARRHLEELMGGEARRAQLVAERERVLARLAAARAALGRARSEAAPQLSREIQERLQALALPGARFEVAVEDEEGGGSVELRFAANRGEPPLPLGTVASGGELARAMLATRLVLTEAPPTLVFDEVDAGVGGAAALAVGRSLAELGSLHQVLVVTHLAQVAAYASSQIAVEKGASEGRTVTSARSVSGQERLAELSRMLSGQPESPAALRHAEELLSLAQSGLAASRSAPAAAASGTLSERTPGRTA